MDNKQKFGRNNWVILILFGLVGQLAWSVENMYFNLFVFDTIAKDLGAITLMVQLSGVMATVATLVAGIDMTKPEVITSAIDEFADCVRQFREIYERNK